MKEAMTTKKELVDAIFTVCERHKGKFIVGMFGDTMQRIYQDGKENLSQCIPDDWVKPQKIMNHRSASRIVTLANAIRFTVDTQQQRPRSDAEVGNVRLFIVSSDANKEVTEQRVAEIMSEETGDGEWRDSKQYKSLILEHHMAASRFGFLELYLPLNEVPVFNTSLRDGSISELSFLSKVISPLVQAYKGNNDFEVLKIVKEYSPLMESKKWISLDDQTKALQQVESAVDKLMELWKDDAIPTCLDVLRSIQDTGLFKLDERVDNILSSPAADESIRITALRKALSVPFTTLEKYFAYVSDNTRFATHQGVKGLEFPRVMVIINLLNGHDVEADKVQAGEIETHVLLGLNPGLINASGYSWTADYVTVTGDLCADLLSNIASEQRAKVVYEYLYRQIEDKKVRETIDFLLNREEAHNQMFRDAFNEVQDSGSNQDFGTTKAAKMYFSLSNPGPNAFAGNEVSAPKFAK